MRAEEKLVGRWELRKILTRDFKVDAKLDRRCEVNKRREVDPTGEEECLVGDKKLDALLEAFLMSDEAFLLFLSLLRWSPSFRTTTQVFSAIIFRKLFYGILSRRFSYEIFFRGNLPKFFMVDYFIKLVISRKKYFKRTFSENIMFGWKFFYSLSVMKYAKFVLASLRN